MSEIQRIATYQFDLMGISVGEDCDCEKGDDACIDEKIQEDIEHALFMALAHLANQVKNKKCRLGFPAQLWIDYETDWPKFPESRMVVTLVKIEGDSLNTVDCRIWKKEE